MAEPKTKPTNQSVDVFLDSILDEQKRQDCLEILALMKRATGAEPVMWGESIVGLGLYHYKYASGREGDWPLTGFSPRKQNITLYITSGFDQFGELLKRLGKHTTSKSCLYIKRLADVDREVLEQLVKLSVEHMIRTNA